MSLDLTFHGAAGTVTGSCMELRAGAQRILVDCGLFQGARGLEALNHEPLPFDPRKINAIVLTHAHIDHSGRLPLLVRNGCRAKIWCTPPTRQLLRPLLEDSARLQASDAERRNRRPDRAGMPPFEALYDERDVAAVVDLAEPLRYDSWAKIAPGVEVRFRDACHILGSASIEVRAAGQTLLFSGDVGVKAADLAGAPNDGPWDHVICEATYGDRDRPLYTSDQRREMLAEIVAPALERGGNLVIPAFALERTQVILDDLAVLFATGRVRSCPVFVDSPLADKVTRTYRRYAGGAAGALAFDNAHVQFTASVDQSKALNRVSGAIILAGSGMCTGGRIRHHLVRNLPRTDSTVLFVGYQARGTLGAVLKDGGKIVRVMGHDVRVRATVTTLDVYSAHADHAALLRWLSRFGAGASTVFLDHGEPPALAMLAADAMCVDNLPEPICPLLGERFRFEQGAPARRIGAPRPHASDLVAREDWRNLFAAFSVSLEDRLRAMPSDAARRRALEAADRAISRG